MNSSKRIPYQHEGEIIMALYTMLDFWLHPCSAEALECDF